MTRQIRQILVAIGDVQQAPKKELRKAAALARASGASLELFHAIDVPDPGRSYPETATQAAVARQRELIQARSQARLERFARDASLRGIRTTCTAVWDGPPLVAVGPEVEALHNQQVVRAINDLAENAAVPRSRRHINMGDVADELSAVTRRIHTNIVVMGAVSRSALARFFIGNTAEHVLDRLTCDVLIVKPRDFVSSTSATTTVRNLPSAARTGSGSTVITGRVVLPPLF